MIFFNKIYKFLFKIFCRTKLLNGSKSFFNNSHWIFIFCCFIYSPFSLGTIGSITDLSYSQKESQESFFGPLKASLKFKLSRNLRRGNWDEFFSPLHANNAFDSLFLRTDLSLDYSFSEKFSFFEQSPHFKNMSAFLTLSYRRPVYDIPDNIKRYCYQFYFCFGEVTIGFSDSLPQKYKITSQYSVYLSVPMSSKSSYDQKKYLGVGAFFRATYPLLEQDLKIKALFSHFFDVAIYGSRYANAAGSLYNDVFYTLNQLGLSFSLKKSAFIPLVFVYFSHSATMDYDLDFFQRMSFSGSTVWSIGKRLQLVSSLGWGGDIFQHEFSSSATDIDLFNADETSVSGGFSYSF